MIYKLKYTSEEQAKADLINRSIIGEDKEFLQGTQAVVWIGLITLEQPTFDEEMNELTHAIIADGYHVDLMLENEQEFNNQIFPNNAKFTFSI
jgi:hypothetical protein